MNTIGFAITAKFPITDTFFTLDPITKTAISILPKCKTQLKSTLEKYVKSIDNNAQNIRFYVPQFSINDFDYKSQKLGTTAACSTDIIWDTEKQKAPTIDTIKIEQMLTNAFGTTITTNAKDFIPAEILDLNQLNIISAIQFESA